MKASELAKKLDDINDNLTESGKTMVKIQENLADHIRRTELLEKSVQTLESAIKPIEAHVLIFNGIVKLVGFAGLVVGIILGVVRIINHV